MNHLTGRIMITISILAGMEERKLIIRDLFNQGILNEEIVRDFAKTAEAMSAVISIQYLEEEDFVINYLKGEEYESVTEMIPLVH